MKEKVTGIISFIGAVGWAFFGLFIIITKDVSDGDEFFAIFSLLIPTISGMLYIIWTKFGNRKLTELEKTKNDNQLLKLQIEQKELKKRLQD